MKKILLAFLIMMLFCQPVCAENPKIPEPPPQAEAQMPRDTENFSIGFRELLLNALEHMRPDLMEAMKVTISVISATMLISILKTIDGPVGIASDMAGSAAIAGGLLVTSNSLIRLGTETIEEISQYGKLLLPVMTGALAAQGGVTKSTALFAGTTGFMALLCTAISEILIPLTYVYLALSIGYSAMSQEVLKKLRDQVKSVISWVLKAVITVFTTYIGLTGVVSGTADAAALKAARTAVSTVVPVVGSILSGASETMLLSAAVFKNAAGLYGIFAFLAIFLGPFLRILMHYWMLKAASSICGIFGSGSVSGLVEDFSSAMGLLLAMTGTSCLLMLIGTVCYMKGVG